MAMASTPRVGEWNIPRGKSGQIPSVPTICDSMNISREAFDDIKALATLIVRAGDDAKNREQWREVTLTEKQRIYDELERQGLHTLKADHESTFDRIKECLHDEKILDFFAHQGWKNVRNADGKRRRRKVEEA